MPASTTVRHGEHPFPGEIVYSGFNEGYGNTGIVKTTNGYGLYAHMDKPSQARVGDRIWPGDMIGRVGSTGTFSRPLEHDPEKCEAVFRKDHDQTTS